MTKLEQVARAISGAPFATKSSLRKARAALEAMLVPNEAMLAASNWPDDMSAEIFNNMIQAAIDEGK